MNLLTRIAASVASVVSRASVASRATSASIIAIAIACVAPAAGRADPAAVSGATPPKVTLHTSFTPDRLGASTTVGFGFRITASDGLPPAPLTSLDLHLPEGINYLTTTLGLATCEPSALIARGLEGCSPNSRLGYGTAYVEVPFGEGSGQEVPRLEALMGPSHNGNIVVLFYADGREPVYAQIVFRGELSTGTDRLGGNLDAAIPLIPSVAGGPPVSIVSVQSTIGPSHLTYYERVHGKTVSFHPKGVTVPASCPRGGFRFSADFGFVDGTTASAESTVPCPRRRG